MTTMRTAIFGGGCFWCTEAFFQNLKGVKSVESGYAGGKIKNPTYREVCSGMTGHAEVVKIEFDPEQISFKELLDVFFKTHNPTTKNQQGADVGTQYRSVIFYLDEEQKDQALEYIKGLEQAKVFDKSISTEVSRATEFYKAEEYHQDYYHRNPAAQYCTYVIEPKLQKFQKEFSEKIRG